jgi:hypothetical protein
MPTAETQEGIPYAGAAERMLDGAVAEAAVTHQGAPQSPPSLSSDEPDIGQSEPMVEDATAAAPVSHQEAHSLAQHGEAPSPPDADEAVLTVAEKPENPRRGWWQRLIQS